MLASARLVSLTVLAAGCAVPPEVDATAEPGAPAPEPGVRVLFDGRTLGELRPSVFGGDGAVTVEDGRLVLEMGSPLTGVAWRGAELPTVDYEVEFRAARLAGSDFFCGLTFPVRDGHATLVLGGWGGSLCGISSIDGLDASENETTRFRRVEDGREYAVRLRVTADRIAAWLDGEVLVDVEIDGRELSVRPEVEPSLPFGVASFGTRAAVGPIRLRELPPR